MIASLQFIVPVLVALTSVIVTGNYMINRIRGMCSSENLLETKMWGVGFFIYGIFDYLILLL